MKTGKRKETSLKFDEKRDPHLTKQDHGGSADINSIARQYMDGRLPYPENPPAQYADISKVDVQHARNVLAAVESEFSNLPSDVRAYFGHDAQNYVGYLDNNREEIAEKGLRDHLWDSIHGEAPASEEPAEAAEAPEIAQNAAEAAATDAR